MGGEVVDQEIECVACLVVVHLVDVVDDEHDGVRVPRQGGDEPRYHLTDDRDAGRLGVELGGRDAERAGGGGGDEDEELRGASVARTERDPGERAVVAASPLREQGPLAEADRRRQCDHSAIRCGDQLIDQRRAVDETGPIRRHVKLVLDESPTDLIVCTRAHLVRPPVTHAWTATYVAVPASLRTRHSTLPHGAERTGG